MLNLNISHPCGCSYPGRWQCQVSAGTVLITFGNIFFFCLGFLAWYRLKWNWGNHMPKKQTGRIYGPTDDTDHIISVRTKTTSMGLCKKDVTSLLTHWSYVFLALIQWHLHTKTKQIKGVCFFHCTVVLVMCEVHFKYLWSLSCLFHLGVFQYLITQVIRHHVNPKFCVNVSNRWNFTGVLPALP